MPESAQHKLQRTLAFHAKDDPAVLAAAKAAGSLRAAIRKMQANLDTVDTRNRVNDMTLTQGARLASQKDADRERAALQKELAPVQANFVKARAGLISLLGNATDADALIEHYANDTDYNVAVSAKVMAGTYAPALAFQAAQTQKAGDKWKGNAAVQKLVGETGDILFDWNVVNGTFDATGWDFYSSNRQIHKDPVKAAALWPQYVVKRDALYKLTGDTDGKSLVDAYMLPKKEAFAAADKEYGDSVTKAQQYVISASAREANETAQRLYEKQQADAQANLADIQFYIDAANSVEDIASVVADVAIAVVAFIPALGPLVAIAASFALSLARGKPLTDAVVDSIANAIPGGFLGQTVFRVGEGALSGKSLDEIGIDVLPVPREVKDQIGVYVSVVKTVADGAPLDRAFVASVIAKLPDVRKAAAEAASKVSDAAFVKELSTQVEAGLPKETRDDVMTALTKGVSVGQAKILQEQTAKVLANPDFLGQAQAKASEVLDRQENEFLRQAKALVPLDAQRGYDVGLSMLAFNFGPYDYGTVKRKLSPAEQTGFDQSFAAIVGKAKVLREQQLATSKAKVPPAPKPPLTKVESQEAAAYLVASGLSKASLPSRVGVLTNMADVPAAQVGVSAAIKAKEGESKGVIAKILDFLFGWI